MAESLNAAEKNPLAAEKNPLAAEKNFPAAEKIRCTAENSAAVAAEKIRCTAEKIPPVAEKISTPARRKNPLAHRTHTPHARSLAPLSARKSHGSANKLACAVLARASLRSFARTHGRTRTPLTRYARARIARLGQRHTALACGVLACASLRSFATLAPLAPALHGSANATRRWPSPCLRGLRSARSHAHGRTRTRPDTLAACRRLALAIITASCGRLLRALRALRITRARKSA